MNTRQRPLNGLSFILGSATATIILVGGWLALGVRDDGGAVQAMSADSLCEEMLIRSCMTKEDCHDIAVDIHRRENIPLCYATPTTLPGPLQVCGENCGLIRYENSMAQCMDEDHGYVTLSWSRNEREKICVDAALKLASCYLPTR